MSTSKKIFLNLTFIIILFPYAINAQGDGVLLQDKDNIRIYKEQTDGSRKFKVLFEVNSELEQIENLVLTPTIYTSWFENILEVKKVNTTPDSLQTHWILIGVNKIFIREGVIRTHVISGVDNDMVKIEQELENPSEYNTGNYKPIRAFKGGWILRQTDSNCVQVEINFEGGEEDNAPILNNVLEKILIRKLNDIAENIRLQLSSSEP